MRGKVKIINSAADAAAENLTAEKIIEMATINVRYDDAVYPENYDRHLIEGDDGYITPIYRTESEVDRSVLNRFGVSI